MTTFENCKVKFLKNVKSGTKQDWAVFAIERSTPLGKTETHFVAKKGKNFKAGQMLTLKRLVISDDACPKLVDAE